MKTLMSYKKGYRPNASELKAGQLAINFPDHAIYGRTDDGKVVQLGYLLDPTGETTEGVGYFISLETKLVTCNNSWHPLDTTVEFSVLQVQPDGSAIALTEVPIDMRFDVIGATFTGGATTLAAGDTIPATLDVSGTKSESYVTRLQVFDLLFSDVVPMMEDTINYISEAEDGSDGSDGSDGDDGIRGSVALMYDIYDSSYTETTTGSYNRGLQKYRETGNGSWQSVDGSNDVWYELMRAKLNTATGTTYQVKGDIFRFQLYNNDTSLGRPLQEISPIATATKYPFAYGSWDYTVVLYVNGSMIVEGTIYSEAISTGAITADKLDSGAIDINNKGYVSGGDFIANIGDGGNSGSLIAALRVITYNGNSCNAVRFGNGNVYKGTIYAYNAGSTTANGGKGSPVFQGYTSNAATASNITIYNTGDVETEGSGSFKSGLKAPGSYFGYQQDVYPDLGAWLKFDMTDGSILAQRGSFTLTDKGAGHWEITLNGKQFPTTSSTAVLALASAGGVQTSSTTINSWATSDHSWEVRSWWVNDTSSGVADFSDITVIMIGEAA